MYTYLLLQLGGLLTVLAVVGYVVYLVIKRRRSGDRKLSHLLSRHTASRRTYVSLAVVAFLGLTMGGIGAQNYPIHSAVPLKMHAVTPDGNPPSLPFVNGIDFMLKSRDLAKVEDIGADFNAVPAPLDRITNETVTFDLTAKEVLAEVAPGVHNNYWTYNGQVPGPMLRVKVGDNVIVNLTNDETSLHDHSIDLHAVNGPGGGAEPTTVKPGETRSFQFKALNPGLYIYHCATSNVSVHNAHGQFGLILVEPKEGLPPVDRELYVVQSELYTQGGVGRKGLLFFDSQALLDGNPSYVTFNGRVESTPRMEAKVGETVRMYVGNGGVNLVSSFHVIGEIFDTVYPEAAIGSEPHRNIQTTAVLPGGATIVEFTLDVPGSYILVDHALARMNKGAWAVLSVEGDENPEVFKSDSRPRSASTGH